MLLSVPSKILTRIILERLKKALDKTLQEEQAGFRQEDPAQPHCHAANYLEQSLEWQTPLYSVFVDFQKAFDSVDRMFPRESRGLSKQVKQLSFD